MSLKDEASGKDCTALTSQRQVGNTVTQRKGGPRPSNLSPLACGELA